MSKMTAFVLTRNRNSELARCLRSVVSQLPADAELLVVVNGTEDDSADMVAKEFPRARVLVEHTNHGCPGGRNIGIQAATNEWVLCIDDDGWLPDGAVTAAEEAISDHTNMTVLAGLIVETSQDWGDGPVRRTGIFTGGICVVHRDRFLELGGYHDDGLRQGEETEFAIRLHESGGQIWHEPRMRLVHPFDHSPAKRAEIIRSGTRQMILTAVKYAPGYALVPYVCFRWLSFLRVAVRWRTPWSVLLGTADAFRSLNRARSQRSPVRWSSLMAVSGRSNWQ